MEIPSGSIAIWDERHSMANFAPVPVTLFSTSENALRVATAEQLYQVCKFLPRETHIRHAIVTAKSPSQAKEVASEHKSAIRRDWSDIQKKVMYGVIRMKLRQNPDVQQELIETGNAYIYEDADQYAPSNPTPEEVRSMRRWGIYEGEGENLIGEMLMDMRAQIIEHGKL